MNWIGWLLVGAVFGFGTGLLTGCLMVILSENLIEGRKWWRIW